MGNFRVCIMAVSVAAYNPQVFDALLSLGDAHAAFHSVSDGLNALRGVIDTHGLADAVGVQLLHAHFEMENDEILAERIVNDVDTYSITKPTNIGDIGSFVPHVFQLDPSAQQILPLEFTESTDYHAAVLKRLTQSPEFIREYTSVLIENDLRSSAGLCILPPAVCSTDDKLVETDGEDRELLLKCCPHDTEVHPENDYLHVVWTAGGPLELKTCKKYCWYDDMDNTGKHSEKKKHKTKG